MKKYYRMSSDMKRRTPYAPTIISNNSVFLSNCPKCGRTRYNKSNRDLSFLIEGKGKLPDTLLCGHYPLTIVSDKVLKAWENEGVTGYESFPVKLVNSEQIEIDDQQYHNITIMGRAELDFSKMGVTITNICDVCGGVEYNKETWEFGPAIIKENSYDNSDLFVCKHFISAPLCSLKVLKIVYESKLSNFYFENFETSFMIGHRTAIDLKELLK